MKRPLGGCHLLDALRLRSPRPLCAKCLNRSALQCRQVSGPLFNAASPKSQCNDISAPVKFRPLWKPFNRPRSFQMIPVSIEACPRRRSCTVCNTCLSGKETFSCWWGRLKEHSCFVRTLNVNVGKLAVPISTDRLFTRWPMTGAVVNIAYGRQRRVFGERYCGSATISGRVGPILRRRRFDFPGTVVFR